MTRPGFALPAALATLVAFAALADPQAPFARTPADTLLSPEVLPGHRVTFRFYAPNAKDVSVGGDWKPSSPAGEVKLSKDESGVWSVTVGPLVPDYYTYTFTVDGLRLPDPKNVHLKTGVNSLESILFVPGPEAAFESERNVPHGEVRQVWYSSKTLGRTRRMHVYTPPGYDTGTERYPVLYLMHGGGDEDSGWIDIGRANFILDNLLAAKAAVPMIVVMPDGSTARDGPRPAFVPGKGPESFLVGDRLGDDLVDDIIPWTDANLRTLTGRDHRAMAGLSMGGLQVLWFGLPNFDKFAWFGIFSSGQTPAGNAEFEKEAARFLEAPGKTNQMVKLLWIAYGQTDIANANSKNMIALLARHGIRSQSKETPGGHTWINWRAYLNEFAPLLFRTKGTDRQ